METSWPKYNQYSGMALSTMKTATAANAVEGGPNVKLLSAQETESPSNRVPRGLSA